MTINNLFEVTYDSLLLSWGEVVAFLPKLLLALVFFVAGWIVSVIIGRVVEEILNRIKFNKIFDRTGWKEALERAEIKVNPSEFIGAIIKWVLVIIFLMVTTDMLRWISFSSLLRDIVGWLPNLIVAIAIFVVAVILADILEKIIRASVVKMKVSYAEFLGVVVKWAIYIFATFIILRQLGVAPTIIDTLVMGFVLTITLAVGLSFGLGGRDAAAKMLEDFRKKISEK